MPIPKSSYYNDHNRPGAALLRARRPFIIKNAVAGVGIFAFVIAVYSFTIKAVSQDDFSDVVVPDKPRQVAGAPHAGPPKSLGMQQLEK